MGLDDLLPDDVEKSTSSRSNKPSSKPTEPTDYVKKITGPNGRTKYLNEEQWEKAQKVIREKTRYTVGEVVSQLPATERYHIIHECLATRGYGLNDKHKPEVNCVICGTDCRDDGVEIDEEVFCPDHTARQVYEELS